MDPVTLGIGAVALLLLAGKAGASSAAPASPEKKLPSNGTKTKEKEQRPPKPPKPSDKNAPAPKEPDGGGTILVLEPGGKRKPETPLEAAGALRDYLSRPGAQWGSKGKPSAAVQHAQKTMGGGIKADGIYGPATRARAKALGVSLPARPSSSAPAPAPKVTIGPARITKPKPKAAPKPAKPKPPKASSAPPPRPPAPAPASTRAARLEDVKPDKGRPPRFESATRPARSLPAPSARAPKQAALELLEYTKRSRPAQWGTKAAPNPIVRAAQKDMGSITADGIYGPSTRSRAKALGVTLPPRQ